MMKQMARPAGEQPRSRLAGVHSRSDRVINLAVYIILFLITAVTVYPLLYVVSSSFSSPAAVLAGEVYALPVRPTLMSYQKIFSEGTLNLGLTNSLIITVAGTLINLAVTTAGAYALSCRELRGRSFFTKMILFTMLFSGGMIPTFLVVKSLGLINTLWAVMLPNAVSVTNFIVMKNTFETSIPQEIKEASFVEGASQFTTFVRVVLPLSLPILAVMTMFYCVSHWNEYFNALIYLTEKDLWPLQVVLRNILVSNEINETISDGNKMTSGDRLALAEGIRYAIIVISSIPMIAMYPFFQKFFVKGVMVGAVKG